MTTFFDSLRSTLNPEKLEKAWDDFTDSAEKIYDEASSYVQEECDNLFSEENKKKINQCMDQVYEVLEGTSEVALNATKNAVIGVAASAESLVRDSVDIAENLYHGKIIDATGVIVRRGTRVVSGILSISGSAFLLAENGVISVLYKKSFFTHDNVIRITQLLSVGMVIGTGYILFTPDMPEGEACGLWTDNSISGIENGVFIGDASDLQRLIELGEDSHTIHIPSEDVVRSMAVRDDFLQMHGFDHCPENFQVHHIFPLSEGGSDSVDNMVLIDNENHATITAAHDAFYHWGHHASTESTSPFDLGGIDHQMRGVYSV